MKTFTRNARICATIACLLPILGGCADNGAKEPAPQAQAPVQSPPAPQPVAPAAPLVPATPTEQQLVEALRRAYGPSLPSYLKISGAPFTVVEANRPSFQIQGKMLIEALEPTYLPKELHLTNDMGKSLQSAVPVLRVGTPLEVPFTLHIAFVGTTVTTKAPPLGRDVRDLGVPLPFLSNAYDIETPTGKRLDEAPKRKYELIKAVDSLNQSRWKLILDQIRGRIDQRESYATLGARGSFQSLYPETQSQSARINADPDVASREKKFRALYEERFEADYAKFYEEFDAAQKAYADFKAFLNSL